MDAGPGAYALAASYDEARPDEADSADEADRRRRRLPSRHAGGAHGISTKTPDHLHTVSKHRGLARGNRSRVPRRSTSPPATRTNSAEDATNGTHAPRSHVLPVAQDGQ